MNIIQKLIEEELELKEFGFYWPNFQMIIDQTIDECREIKEAIDLNEPASRIQEEIGDLLHCAISMCIFKGLSVEQTIIYTERKFAARIKALRDIAVRQGYTTLKGQSVETLLDLWKQAKESSTMLLTSNNILIRRMVEDDITVVVDKLAKDNWPKPISIFENYLVEHEANKRLIWVAFYDDQFAGYVTLKWHSNYAFFLEQNIPEINDLNVLPSMRNKGIGSALLEACENAAKSKSARVGLGVGLYTGYGAAQKLYIEREYIPDGQGITYNDKQVQYGESIPLNDNLILWFIKKLR